MQDLFHTTVNTNRTVNKSYFIRGPNAFQFFLHFCLFLITNLFLFYLNKKHTPSFPYRIIRKYIVFEYPLMYRLLPFHILTIVLDFHVMIYRAQRAVIHRS